MKFEKNLGRFTALLSFGALLCLSVCLSSCENFLNGASIKKELEYNIAYASAESCPLSFKSDESMGTFLAGSAKEFKIGFPEDVLFSVNKENYIFKSLEAISLVDSSVSRSEYVEFSVNTDESDSEKGIYTISVKILKASNDICIRPVCIAYPAAVSHYPASIDEAHFANEPIQIRFNEPVEDTDVSKENSIFNYKNIMLVSNGNSVIEYFEKPVFNKEKTILTIAPKGPAFKKIIKSSYIDVSVSLKENMTVTVGGVSLPLKQNENSDFTVRYKPAIENVNPKIESLFVTRQKYSIEESKSLGEADKFAEGSISQYDEEKIYQNKTNGSICIYGRCYDADSGVKRLAVIEERECDSKANSVTTLEQAVAIYDDENALFETKNGTTEFRIEHKLQSEDGLIKLTVVCYDACDNKYEYPNEIHIVKQSRILFYRDEGIYIGNAPGIPITSEESIQEFNSNLKSLKVNAGRAGGAFGQVGYADCVLYGYCMTPPEKLNLNLKYTDKDGLPHDEDFTYYDNTDPTNPYQWDAIGWTLDLKNVDSVVGMDLFLTVTDDIGNSYEKKFSYLPEPKLSLAYKGYYASVNGSITTVYGTFVNYQFDSDVSSVSGFLVRKNLTDGTITRGELNHSNSDVNDARLDDDYEYRLCLNQDGLYSPIGTETFRKSDYSSESLGYLFCTGAPILAKSSLEGYIDVTVKLSEAYAPWENFDSIFIELGGKVLAYFEPGELTCTFRMSTLSMFRNQMKPLLYGLKGKLQSTAREITLPKLTDIAMDNNPPKIYRAEIVKKEHDSDTCSIGVWDRESGISKVYIVTPSNQNVILYDNPEGIITDVVDWTYSILSVDIPLHYVLTESTMINGKASLKIVVEDVAGNKTEAMAPSEVFDSMWLGKNKNSGMYDLLFPNGSSKTSFAVSSDAPVYIHTLCKQKNVSHAGWTLDDWEANKLLPSVYGANVYEAGFQFIEFSESDYTPKRYNVPDEVINSGYPYCVVVHFADGSTLMSDVVTP